MKEDDKIRLHSKIFSSGDGLWIRVQCEETEGKPSETVLTGGLNDIRSGLPRALLLRVKSEESADPNKLTEVTRDFLAEKFGHPPLAMPPSLASGLIDFRLEGLHNLDLEETFDGLANIFSNIEIARSSDQTVIRSKLAQRLATLRRQRQNRDADSFSSAEVTALLNEIEEDYGELVKKLSGRSFVRDDSLISSHWAAPTLLSLNWATRYIDEDIRKEATVDFSIVGKRAMQRIEERVEVPPSGLGRLLGRKASSTIPVRSERTDEMNLQLSMVSNYLFKDHRTKHIGKVRSGGLHDFAQSIPDDTRTEERKVILAELITPRSLESLDIVMTKAMMAFERNTGWTFGSK